MSECSCFVEYPNPMHKNKNGTWKCVDKYECIRNLETVETPIGITAVKRKTHCRRKPGIDKKSCDNCGHQNVCKFKPQEGCEFFMRT